MISRPELITCEEELTLSKTKAVISEPDLIIYLTKILISSPLSWPCAAPMCLQRYERHFYLPAFKRGGESFPDWDFTFPDQKRQFPWFRRSLTAIQHYPGYCRTSDDHRFGQFKYSQACRAGNGDDNSREIDDRTFRKNDGGAGDGARGRCGRSFDETFQGGMLAVPYDIAADEKDKQIHGQEDCARGNHRTG